MEDDGRMEFLERKITKIERAVGGIFSATASASTINRIHGNLLIPESVNGGVIQDLAITETKIDSEAVTTPKIAANAVTANKLTARLVLATEVVAGSYADPNYTGVRLDASGLRLYDGSGVQRGLMSGADGSGWLGSSTGFTWSAAGAITVTGVTVRSASSTARAELDSTGLSLYRSSGAKTGYLNTDGSGFLGSTDGTAGNAAISWNTTGTTTINANRITTGTLNAQNVAVTNINASNVNNGSFSFANGGTFNTTGSYSGTLGSMSLGTLTVSGQITIGAGGKIVDADGSEWAQGGFILKSTGSFGDVIKWQTSGTDKGSIHSTAGDFTFYSNVGATLWGSTGVALIANSGNMTLYTNTGSSILFTVNNTNNIDFVPGGHVQADGSFYPGNQTTRYFGDNGSALLASAQLDIASGATLNLVSPGTGGSASNWSSFTVANIPDKSAGYLILKIAGTSYRVPFYADG